MHTLTADEIMLHIWLRPKDSISLNNVQAHFRQRRGNGLLCTAGMLKEYSGKEKIVTLSTGVP
jgi:hypothetical protein